MHYHPSDKERAQKVRKGVKRARSKPRPGRLKGKSLKALREQCYERDGGICQTCYKPVDPSNWHMVHRRAKRIHGDSLGNVAVKHPYCHLVLEHNPKSVPSKRVDPA